MEFKSINFKSKRKNISNSNTQEKFVEIFYNYIFKLSNQIENFQFNVAVASIYEIYNNLFSSIDKEIENSVLKMLNRFYDGFNSIYTTFG